MATGDGNGWVVCPHGHRHWGRFGAAGLILVRTSPAGDRQILMQLRAAWTHEGGRWGVPGGARDSHESIADAAIREAGEEAGLEPSAVHVTGTATGTDHGNWTYTYALALADPSISIGPPNEESDALAWVDVDSVPDLHLHAGLAAAWPRLRAAIEAEFELS